MSDNGGWVTLPDGRKVRETSGDIEVLNLDGTVTVAHYGELGETVDDAAIASVSGVIDNG